MKRLSRRPHLPIRAAALVALAVLVVVPSALAAHTDTGGWTVSANGTQLTGTFTNPTASVVNGVAVGTALKSKNPIVAFTFEGQTCGLYAPYGSAYCYTNVKVKPGQTVSFSGETKTPIGCAKRRLSSSPPATCGVVQMCDSADKGMDNTCTDVQAGASASGGTKKTPTWVSRAVNAKLDLEQALRDEARAASLLQDFKYTQAVTAIRAAQARIDLAMGDLKKLKDIVPPGGDQSDAQAAFGSGAAANSWDSGAIQHATNADKDTGDTEISDKNLAVKFLSTADMWKDKTITSLTALINSA